MTTDLFVYIAGYATDGNGKQPMKHSQFTKPQCPKKYIDQYINTWTTHIHELIQFRWVTQTLEGNYGATSFFVLRENFLLFHLNMSKVLLVIGICHVISGGVIVGIAGKLCADTLDSLKTLESSVFPDKDAITSIETANAFGLVLIGLLVVTNGVFGVLTMCSHNNKMDVFYLTDAAVAASAAAAMIWMCSLNIYYCDSAPYKCNKEVWSTRITLLAFSVISCAMSVYGMVISAFTICRKL